MIFYRGRIAVTCVILWRYVISLRSDPSIFRNLIVVCSNSVLLGLSVYDMCVLELSVLSHKAQLYYMLDASI